MSKLPQAAELVFFTPSDSYAEDPAGFLETAGVAQRAGKQRAYYGYLMEDYRTAVWVLTWISFEYHQQFMESERYPEIVIPLMDAFIGRNDMVHVLCPEERDLFRTLDAPVTQFTRMTLKHGHKMHEIIPLAESLENHLRFAEGFHSSACGRCAERDDVYVAMTGWNSLDTAEDAFEDTPAGLVISRIRQIASVEITHTSLSLVLN